MKIAGPSLLMITVILIIMAGAYYFVEHEYVGKAELARLDGRLALLQEELGRLKHETLDRSSKNILNINDINNKIGLLQETVTTLRNSFLEWKGTKESELEKTNRTLASLQRQADELLLSLQSYIKELRENYLSKSESVNYYSTAIDLGSLPSGKSTTLSYKIPDQVPDTAREILIYAYIATDFVKGGERSIKIAVKLDDSREAAFYLYAHADTKPSWAYNSDNVWLPMPADREVRLEVMGEPLFGSWKGGVKIIAYR